MTTTTRPTARRRTVYGATGQPVASLNPARSVWLGSLLAECEHNHVYVVSENWPADDTACPRCRLLGVSPGAGEGNHDAD